MAAAADRLWSHLLDVERIAPCLPGAELTEVVDDRTWRGRMKMKFGPVAMTFAGTVTMVDRNDDDHRVVLRANGTESKGKGAATAEVTSGLEADGDGTLVKMHADITLQGFVAQVSRGMLPDISAKLTQQFADCLRADMTATESEEATGSRGDAGERATTSGSMMPTSATDLAICLYLADCFSSGETAFSGSSRDSGSVSIRSSNAIRTLPDIGGLTR